MRKFSKYLIHFLFLLQFACVASPGKVLRKTSSLSDQRTQVRFVFTGFSKYQEEEKAIRKELEAHGYKDDQDAQYLFEVVLEELEPKYKRPFLHRINLIVSIGTLTLIPFHNQTEHRIMLIIRENGYAIEEVSLKTKFHQWRGLLLIPFMYSFWPSSEFTEYMQDSVKKELVLIK